MSSSRILLSNLVSSSRILFAGIVATTITIRARVLSEENTEMSGADFTAQYGRVYFKWINGYRQHYGFRYRLGLNVDNVPFEPAGECRAGGLYFTNCENIHSFKSCGELLAKVIVPDDARVWIESNKFKADKLIIETFEYKFNAQETLNVMRRSPVLALEYAAERTPEICMAAVQQDGRALMYVPESMRTPELCMTAVRQDGLALEYVPSNLRTFKMYWAAVRQAYERFLNKYCQK